MTIRGLWSRRNSICIKPPDSSIRSVASVLGLTWAGYESPRFRLKKEEAYVRQVLNYFNSILLANQNNSPWQLK